MEHTKKMILVSPDVINRMHSHQSDKVKDETISNLDKDMKDVLLSNSNDHDKWRMYEQVLQRYLYFLGDSRKPVEIPIVDVHQKKAENVSTGSLVKSDIMNMVPKSFRHKANSLLNYLDNKKADISWDDRGRVTIGNKLISNSNIVDLINDIVRTRKSSNPKGWMEFATILKNLNVPLELIGNSKRVDFILKGEHEDENVSSQRDSSNDGHETDPDYNKTNKKKTKISNRELRSGWKKLKF